MTWVKICGITNLEDARTAVEAGADALGFVFYEKSLRNVTPGTVREIVRQMPAQVEKVGVFVGGSPKNLPELAHMASLTFDDVVVFPGEVNDRRLFHALVHAAQFEILGLERYAELFVRGFLRVRSHVSVPLEMQAFSLEAKFAENPNEAFAVEELIRLWVKERRY